MDNEKWEEESESKPDEAEVGGSGKEAGAGVENMVRTGDAEVVRQNEGEANVLG